MFTVPPCLLSEGTAPPPPGPLTYIGVASTASATNQTDIVVAKPVGTLDGDLMVAIINLGGNAALGSPPLGWTHLGASPSKVALDVYWSSVVVQAKIASSEPTDYTWSRDVPLFDSITGAILTFRNARIVPDFITMPADYVRYYPSDIVYTGVDALSSIYVLASAGFHRSVTFPYFYASAGGGCFTRAQYNSTNGGQLHVQTCTAVAPGPVGKTLELAVASSWLPRHFITLGLRAA